MSEQLKPQKRKSAEEELAELKAQDELPEPPHLNPKLAQKVYADGDLLKLTEEERLEYYEQVCLSLKLNPLTRPFEFILQKIKSKEYDPKTKKQEWIETPKMILYAKRDCTDQLRKIWNISVDQTDAKIIEGIYSMKVVAFTPNGRRDFATGSVPMTDFDGNKLTGEKLSNAVMKAETKAKRRVTLSICGLGFTDESEFDTMQGSFYPAPISSSDPPKKPSKSDIVNTETKSNPATSQPEKKVALTPHADGMPLKPAPLPHPKTETEMLSKENQELLKAKEKAIADAQKQFEMEEPENPFEDDMGEADLKALADDKPVEHTNPDKPQMVMTVDELIANASHTTVKSKAGKDVDAITFIFKDGSMFDMTIGDKSYKIISKNGKSVNVAKSISDYNADLKVLAVPVWCMTMKADDKAKWQELLEAKN